jgi:hypothetical protein
MTTGHAPFSARDRRLLEKSKTFEINQKNSMESMIKNQKIKGFIEKFKRRANGGPALVSPRCQ